MASVLFGVALLAAKESLPFAHAIVGHIALEGFIDLKIPCLQRRLAIRALVPAVFGVLWLAKGPSTLAWWQPGGTWPGPLV